MTQIRYPHKPARNRSWRKPVIVGFDPTAESDLLSAKPAVNSQNCCTFLFPHAFLFLTQFYYFFFSFIFPLGNTSISSCFLDWLLHPTPISFLDENRLLLVITTYQYFNYFFFVLKTNKLITLKLEIWHFSYVQNISTNKHTRSDQCTIKFYMPLIKWWIKIK